MFLFILVTVITAIAEGLVTYTTWNLFIVPFGVISVSLPQMVGIQLAIRYFKPREYDTEDLLQIVGSISIATAIVLGFIFICGHLM